MQRAKRTYSLFRISLAHLSFFFHYILYDILSTYKIIQQHLKLNKYIQNNNNIKIFIQHHVSTYSCDKVFEEREKLLQTRNFVALYALKGQSIHEFSSYSSSSSLLHNNKTKKKKISSHLSFYFFFAEMI